MGFKASLFREEEGVGPGEAGKSVGECISQGSTRETERVGDTYSCLSQGIDLMQLWGLAEQVPNQ